MSVSEDSVSCPSVTVHVDPSCVSDSECSVLDYSNVHDSCHVEEESQNDCELLKGLLTNTFCQVCEAVLMYDSQRVSHYEGKKHAQRVRMFLQTKKAERSKQSFQSVSDDPEKFCKLCNMVFSSPLVAKSHYTGKVHAKNTRKISTTYCLDASTTVSSVAAPVTDVEDAPEAISQGTVDQGQKQASASSSPGVDLSDPDKYCKLCVASFNNPVMAAEHYIGRKHQRNLARKELHTTTGEQSEEANSLTSPVCHVTLSSIDAYQAHMKGNKHHTKERMQEDLGKKKVYDSFQDELADYIQVQRSRGLEPKTGQGSETQEQRKGVPEHDDSMECSDKPNRLSLHSRLPAPVFQKHPWRPPLHPHPNRAAFRGRFPVPNLWDQGYSSYPPPLIPGLTGRALRKMRCPDSFSSSSSSTDSSSSYSSSSSSSEDSRERRRRRRKKKREGMKKSRVEEGDLEEDVQRMRRERRKREDGSTKKPKRQTGSSDEDHGKKCKEKRDTESVSNKRRREEEGGVGDSVSHGAVMTGDGEGEAQSEGLKEEKTKHKKEKKKPEDNRTEEEKLWDESILGIF